MMWWESAVGRRNVYCHCFPAQADSFRASPKGPRSHIDPKPPQPQHHSEHSYTRKHG
ncbi:hypothetical protein BU26DRAFT_32134 [Trematosphaeria pertusa]|uniref:Uncharacterized protein n=1 Tax=Trematosphaeria pertusa TaxID=390896 RepID=A0A6A6J3Z9_9PLEO|nr:uncharacterized protein BU26DRAFT_32134 [Trematosphaeria pertusa]KAF2256932.1 hypothetical protein BU26DRAFT_32134 [Trematosphaeria pertusa]